MQMSRGNAASSSISSSNNKRAQQVLYLVFNFVSTVAVTLINKLCFTHVQFVYPAALCNVHYVLTWLGVDIMRRRGMFDPPVVVVVRDSPPPPTSPQQTPVKQSKSSSTATCTVGSPSLRDRPLYHDVNFVAIAILIGTVTPLNNTSLQLNSVGFYQLFKLLVTPAVVVLEYVLDGTVLSRYRSLSQIAVCVFVLISTGSDLEFSVYGTACASIWVPLAAGYKVQWGRVLKRYQCSTPAMMHAVLPYAIAVQTLLMPLVDPPGLLSFRWTPAAAAWIGLSGVAAFLVNLSGFLVMGELGALAHVLLGQLKTSVICLGAYYAFGTRYTPMQLGGAAGAVLAIVAYTYVTTTEKKNMQKMDACRGGVSKGSTMMLPLLKKDSDIISSNAS